MIKKFPNELTAVILAIAAVAVMGWLLLSTEQDVLFRMQEQSLFLPTKHFFNTSTIYPGGTLTWMAAWCTQFLFNPTTGVCLLMGQWAVIILIIIHLFKLRGPWQLLSLLVPMALLACLTQTGYWIYYMKLQGHVFVPTLGVLFSLIFAEVYATLPQRLHINKVWFAVIAILGYPFMGAWSFLAIALIAIITTYNKEYIYAGIGIAVAAIVPWVWCQWGYGQVEPKYIYMATMPSFQYNKDNLTMYHYAYYALALSFIVIAAIRFIPKNTKKWLHTCIAIVCVAIGIWGVNNRWYRDTNFYKEVAMTNCIEQLNWEETLRTMTSNKYGEGMPPTRTMVMYKNLALFRLGRAGDELFRYPDGSEQQHAPWNVKMTQVGGKVLYYNYGKADFSYRWCIEDGVEYGWSVSLLKYMAKNCLVSNDWEVAGKYLRLLKKTKYHSDWAKHYEQFLYHPELMAKEKEFEQIVPMAMFPDNLDGDNTLVELYLLKTFANGHGADPWYQETTLICSLLMKDIDLFWPRLREYINMHNTEPGFQLPRYYQEATYLYSVLEPTRQSALWPDCTNEQALQRLPFDPGIKQKYDAFMAFNTQCGSMSEEQKAVAFYPQFGDTFYYFYFLVRNRKTN